MLNQKQFLTSWDWEKKGPLVIKHSDERGRCTSYCVPRRHLRDILGKISSSTQAGPIYQNGAVPQMLLNNTIEVYLRGKGNEYTQQLFAKRGWTI